MTKFVFKVYPQSKIWVRSSCFSHFYINTSAFFQGGVSTVNSTFVDNVSNAVFNFQQNVKDPKAQIILAYVFSAGVVRKGKPQYEYL